MRVCACARVCVRTCVHEMCVRKHIFWHRRKLQRTVHQCYSVSRWGGDINQAKSRDAAFVCAHIHRQAHKTHLIVYTTKDLFV